MCVVQAQTKNASYFFLYFSFKRLRKLEIFFCHFFNKPFCVVKNFCSLFLSRFAFDGSIKYLKQFLEMLMNPKHVLLTAVNLRERDREEELWINLYCMNIVLFEYVREHFFFNFQRLCSKNMETSNVFEISR